MGAAQRPWTDHIAELRTEIADGRLLGPRIMALGPLIDGSKLMRPMATVATNADNARQAVVRQNRAAISSRFSILSRARHSSPSPTNPESKASHSSATCRCTSMPAKLPTRA